MTDKKTARKAFVDYLSIHGAEIGTKSAADYDIEVKPFGQSTWLVKRRLTKCQREALQLTSLIGTAYARRRFRIWYTLTPVSLNPNIYAVAEPEVLRT